jgi:adenylate kinase family enzyme
VARIHIVGASGSGTTTLGRALAARLGCAHLDTDDFFWLPTQPPFQHPRPVAERQALLGGALARHTSWVLSGSLCGWGDVFIPQFDRVVFLWIPADLRIVRLRERERARYGRAIAPGGSLRAMYEAFMAWAAAYDDGLEPPQRCRRLHEQWLAALPCPVERILDSGPTEAHVETILRASAPDPG